ncbi:unnamed protein product [Blepharisma stoltei]|uniref:non-specific serine/threonine protein kinase n=1 Tax=Blepharisma stoltei TaxID=1481888 RepID=A0AAU9KDQ3_9CILI|nr:unnamed protein product [Blepharisma stoltei]
MSRSNCRPASSDMTAIRPASGKSHNIGHYIISDTIGEGNFGKVKLGTHVLTGEKVAVKIFDKSKITDNEDMIRITREIEILKDIRHPNLCQLFETVENSKQIYLIMEYISNGDLLEYIIKNRKLAEPQAKKFFCQILRGIEELHKLNISHRDLKPKNILIDDDFNLKIVDFGLSRKHESDEFLKTSCGSPSYLAPEVLIGKEYDGNKADIWSCGVILFVMLCGYLPFDDTNVASLYKKIVANSYYFPKWISAEAKDLIRNILKADPKERLTIELIRKHEWLNGENLDDDEAYDGRDAIDETIFNQLRMIGFNITGLKKSLLKNKKTHLTATYYLLYNKKKLSKKSTEPKEKLKNIVNKEEKLCNTVKIRDKLNSNPYVLKTPIDLLQKYQKVKQDKSRSKTPSEDRSYGVRSISPYSRIMHKILPSSKASTNTTFLPTQPLKPLRSNHYKIVKSSYSPESTLNSARNSQVRSKLIRHYRNQTPSNFSNDLTTN